MNLKFRFLVIVVLAFCFIANTFSFADNFEEDNFSFDQDVVVSTTPTDIPNINARHAVVFDRASKTVLYGKNENEKCKMASTTKILTAIVVIENSDDFNKIVTISSKASHTSRFKTWSFY